MVNQRFENKKKKKFFSLLLVTFLATGLTACGGSPSEDDEEVIIQESSGDNSENSGGSGATTVEDELDFTNSYTYDFELSGSDDEFTIEVDTDSILYIRVHAGDGIAENQSGYDYTYSCIKYKVTVNGDSENTVPLSVVGASTPTPFSWGIYGEDPCAAEVHYDDMDFSDRLGSTSSAEITVSAAKYDFKCTNYNLDYTGSYAATCGSLTSIYDYESSSGNHYYHTVNGEIEVQVNSY